MRLCKSCNKIIKEKQYYKYCEVCRVIQQEINRKNSNFRGNQRRKEANLKNPKTTDTKKPIKIKTITYFTNRDMSYDGSGYY